MFTVKHYRANGVRSISACESFEHDLNTPDVIRLNRPDEDVVVGEGDSVFIENMAGKTVYARRPPRQEGES